MELRVGILMHADFEDKINAKRKISLGKYKIIYSIFLREGL